MRHTEVSTPANASVQNRMNVSIVFNHLREAGPSYRAQMARRLKLSLPAVSRAVENLLEQGYVVEGPEVRSTAGKAVPSVQVNDEKAAVLGINLLSEKLRIAAFDLSGKNRGIYVGRSLAESSNIVDDLQREVRQFFDRLYADHTSPLPRVEAVTVGVPAVVDVKSQKLLNAYLYENLEGVDLSSSLSDALGIPVYVENIVKLAALGEYRYGLRRQYDNLLFIEIGKGVGAGAIVEGELLRGGIGAAGEIGFTLIGEENLNWVGGQRGYLEQHISTDALRSAARRARDGGKESGMTDLVATDAEQSTVEALFQAALSNDRIAMDIVGSAVRKLSVTVVNLCLILNPQIVVLGGDITACEGARTLIADPVRDSLDRLLPFDAPEVSFSSLGQDSGLYGASLMGVESLLTEAYPYALPV